jgi:hypothetical protein
MKKMPLAVQQQMLKKLIIYPILMMKMNYKKASLLFGIASFSLLLSGRAYGVSDNSKFLENSEKRAEKREEIKTKRQENICERITERAENFENRLGNLTEGLKNRKQERLQNWEERKDERDAKLLQFRTRRDVNLEEHFKKLEERAKGNSDQEEAVNKFEEAVRVAIEKRRQAIDTAISTFRTGVDGAISGRKDALTQATDDFKLAQKEAFDTAISECGKGTNAASVKSTLRNSLKSARQGLVDDRQSAEKMQTQMKTLIQTRKKTFEDAISGFKSDMEAAKAELKKAFPEA